MKPITHESPTHENIAGELIRAADIAVEAKLGHRMAIGIFVADLGEEEGHLGWASNAPREDMVALLVEWIGTQSPELVKQAVDRWTALKLLGPGAQRAQ